MQPTQISDLRVAKTSAILRLFLGGHVLTRKEIEGSTGISYGTISIILRHLLKAGILELVGKETSNGGRRADTYRLVPNRYFFAQVSVTSYGFLWSIRDLHGAVRAEDTVPDDPSHPIDLVLAEVARRVLIACDHLGGDAEVISFGVTVPGHYQATTDTIVQPSRQRLASLSVQRTVRSVFDGEVIVESDVNAAASFEIVGDRSGELQGGTTLYIVVTADGTGASIIVDGRILYGATGHAGEIHMIPVTVDGRASTLGEVVDVAAVGAYLVAQGHVDSEPDFPAIRSMIAASDSRLEPAYPRIIEAFAQALYILDSILDPDRIIVSGPYVGFGDRFIADIVRRLMEIADSHEMDGVVIRPAPDVGDLDIQGMWRLQAERWFPSVDIAPPAASDE